MTCGRVWDILKDMLRRILIVLGLLIAVLPYLGLPYDWQMTTSTVVGLLIVTILMFSRRPRRIPENPAPPQEEERVIHVERMEVIERPEVHVEREIVIDAERLPEMRNEETTVEKKVTVIRRRKKKIAPPPFDSEGPAVPPPSV